MRSKYTFVVTVIIALLIINSCEKDEQPAGLSNLSAMNMEEIKSLLFGKWMLVARASFHLQQYTEKDGIYIIFNQDMTFEYLQKDTLRLKDTFKLKWGEIPYSTDSSWIMVVRGYPTLIDDSTSPTGYRTIYITDYPISILNDSILFINYGGDYSSRYKKVK